MNQEKEAKPLSLSTAFSELNCQLTRVIGLSSSVRLIGESLPTTLLTNTEDLSPELIFPALALEISRYANNSISLVEEILQTLVDSGVEIDGKNI